MVGFLGTVLYSCSSCFSKIQSSKLTNLAGSLEGATIHRHFTNLKTKTLSRDRSIIQHFIHTTGIRCFLSIQRLQRNCDCDSRARCAAADRSHNSALDRTAGLPAKLLSGSEDPDVTALPEAVKAKLVITKPLPKAALGSPSPGLSGLANDLKRSRVSRLLPKVTCPSPFHPRARKVPIAELQDVPVTETEKKGLTALTPPAGIPTPPSGLTPGSGNSGKPIAQANIELQLREFDPKNLPKWAEEFAEFRLLTGRSHVDVATKYSLLKHSCKKKSLQKQVKQIVKMCSTWAEVLQRLENTFLVYETDLSVRTQIEELPMLREFPSAAQVSEYVCGLEYLFSRMNVGSYGPTEPHLWLVSKSPTRTWDDCRTTSERKSRTHTYDDLVDLLIKLALEGENDPHMEKFRKRHLGRGGTPTPERGEGKGPKNHNNANKGGSKGGGNLRAMKEVKLQTGTRPLFYCKPVNDKGDPCHAPDCNQRSGCVLQLKRQQHTKDGKTVTHQDHFRCTITCGYCSKRCHYEDECHIKKRGSDKHKRQEAQSQKAQTPSRTPKNGDKGGKGGGKGVARVEPPTPRGAHQRPLFLPLLLMLTLRSAYRGITPPLRGLTPRRGDWPGWPSPLWLQGLMWKSLLRSRGAALKRRTWFSGSS